MMNGVSRGRVLPLGTAERYPRSVLVDFSKLDEKALYSYVDYHNIQVRDGITREELILAVARHFELESKDLDEEATLNQFLQSYGGVAGKALSYEPPSKRHRPNRQAARKPNADLFGPAKVDEQVAAKIDGADATWILATVKRYHASSDDFDVVDEDDETKLIRLARDRIIRLDDNVDQLNKGDSVLAVFPDTTSFYRGRVSKPIKNKSASAGGDMAVYVQFEDDEDETGRLPHRRIAARYVLPDPEEDYCSDTDDIDALLVGVNGVPQYEQLIVFALKQLPNGQGASGDICEVLQDQIQDFYQKTDEKAPNWRGSIRRMLQSPSPNAPYMALEGGIYSLRFY